jgi:hypothetical protein
MGGVARLVRGILLVMALLCTFAVTAPAASADDQCQADPPNATNRVICGPFNALPYVGETISCVGGTGPLPCTGPPQYAANEVTHPVILFVLCVPDGGTVLECYTNI